MFWI